ncbi:hypothetical protein CLV91_2613 [Maribacter vaceletii]|uniref:Uncharacterized protein n=1 Tax=Maribacter vaceletii TaxID=1206816 RepID=A0A495E6A3_9FLAO|nr:hypothetical protein [Maribacter vaceletii]RKR12482.1 hypothetical protein CLV91_2613 [Maribacter vaceletii]
MRIPLLLLLICSILLNCSTQKRILTDLDKIGLKGQVKYLKFESHLTEKDGELTSNQNEGKGIIIDNEFFFNENGMISEQRQYSKSELSQIFVFEYDNHNLLILKNYFNPSHVLVMKSKFENTFNSKGKIIKQFEFRATNNSFMDSTKITYQKMPHKTMEFSYNQNGELEKMTYIQSIFGSNLPKSIMEYRNGLMDKQLLVDSNGSIISSSNIICLGFDKIGNCIKLKTKDNSSAEEYTNAEIKYYK